MSGVFITDDLADIADLQYVDGGMLRGIDENVTSFVIRSVIVPDSSRSCLSLR